MSILFSDTSLFFICVYLSAFFMAKARILKKNRTLQVTAENLYFDRIPDMCSFSRENLYIPSPFDGFSVPETKHFRADNPGNFRADNPEHFRGDNPGEFYRRWPSWIEAMAFLYRGDGPHGSKQWPSCIGAMALLDRGFSLTYSYYYSYD